MANTMKLFRLILVFCALENLVTNAQQPSCPNVYSKSKVLPNTTMKLFYSVVLNPSNPSKSILCAKIVRKGKGWIGFGISPDGEMDGSEAVIGLPGKKTVKKYSLGSKGVIDEMAKQSLISTSIVVQTSGGTTTTVMKFAKYLKESGELSILAKGANTFIYAEGDGNTLGYHGNSRGSISLNFAQSSN